MEKMILEPAQSIQVMEEADIVVVGGGPSGIAAAVTAKRNGAKKVVGGNYPLTSAPLGTSREPLCVYIPGL